MKVLVVGANGKTGHLVVEKALAAGHTVTAFVHSRKSYSGTAQRVVAGDSTDETAMRAAVDGHDAIVDTVGGKTPYKSTVLEQNTVKAIIGAMSSTGARRLIAVSMLGVGDSSSKATLLVRVLVATFLRGANKDKTAMEEEVKKSDLEWTIVRPAVLTDEPAKGSVKIFVSGGSEKASKISRGDLAAFIVDQLSSGGNLRRAVVVGGPA